MLSSPSELIYTNILPLNTNEVDDLKKIVYKFVPQEFREFYDEIIQGNTDTSQSSE